MDLETYGTSEDKKIRKGETLDPWRGEIRLLSLQLPDLVPWLIDLRATGYGLGELGKVLQGTEVIGHNIKFDALWLARKCNVHLVKMVDTSSASRILSNGDSKLGNRLAEVADRYLGIELRKGIALKNTNEESLSECRHPVAAAIVVYRKWKKLKEDVESRIHEIRQKS